MKTLNLTQIELLTQIAKSYFAENNIKTQEDRSYEDLELIHSKFCEDTGIDFNDDEYFEIIADVIMTAFKDLPYVKELTITESPFLTSKHDNSTEYFYKACGYAKNGEVYPVEFPVISEFKRTEKTDNGYVIEYTTSFDKDNFKVKHLDTDATIILHHNY